MPFWKRQPKHTYQSYLAGAHERMLVLASVWEDFDQSVKDNSYTTEDLELLIYILGKLTNEQAAAQVPSDVPGAAEHKRNYQWMFHMHLQIAEDYLYTGGRHAKELNAELDHALADVERKHQQHVGYMKTWGTKID